MAFEDLEAIARKIHAANQSFQQTAKDAYLYTRQHHADPKYEAFRTSDEGRVWKAQKLKEYGHRCPECNGLMNDNNATIDHKYPRRYYPWLAWEVDNFWLLCRRCNRAKSDKEWSVYLAEVQERRGAVVVQRILSYAPALTVS